MVLFSIAGRGLATLLPRRIRPLAAGYLSPALGLAFYILLATAVGWLAGMRPWLVTFLTLGATVWGLTLDQDRAGLGRHLVWMIASAVVISFGPLLSVWKYGGINVYHDAFTYLVHAQWLQSHAFHEKVIPAVLEPAYTQVSLYQSVGLRMGASFLFGWIQAVSPFDWSIYVYPAVISLILAVGAQTVGGLVLALVPAGSRLVALAWTLVVGTSVSGFTYGGFTGFLPQATGLALCTGLIVLLMLFQPAAEDGCRATVRHSLPLAMIFAALGFAYSELLPFVSLTLLGWFAFSLALNQNRVALVTAAGSFITWALLFLNLECGRIFRALLTQATAVVGWAVPWTTGDFAAHCLGLRSGRGDGDWWMLDPILAKGIAWTLLVGVLCLAAFIVGRRRRALLRWSPVLAFLGICVLAFLYFRHVVSSPFPVGVGQTWSQFKLSNWSSPLILALVGAGLALLSSRRIGLNIAGLAIAFSFQANIRAHFALLTSRIGETLRLTGRTTNVFAIYEAIRTAAQTAQPAGTIYLDLSGGDYKSRQLAAYFLHDFPTAGDWTGDGYIYPKLPPEWSSVSLSDCRWQVYRRTSNVSNGVPLSADGALAFSAVPPFAVIKTRLTGGYGEETDSSGWWSWVSDQLTVRLRVVSKLPVSVRLRFTCITATEPYELYIVRRPALGEVSETKIAFDQGWQEYVSEPFELNAGELEVSIASRSMPVPIGPNDPRLVNFLIKNVRLEPLQEP